jgi:hypothetical protein
MLHLWTIAEKLWLHHNNVLHENKTTITEEESNHINRKLQVVYNKLLEKLSSPDEYLLMIPLWELQKKGMSYRKEWLQQAELALSAQLTRLQQDAAVTNTRQRTREVLQAARRQTHMMISQMRNTMCTWLERGRSATTINHSTSSA